MILAALWGDGANGDKCNASRDWQGPKAREGMWEVGDGEGGQELAGMWRGGWQRGGGAQDRGESCCKGAYWGG